MEPTYLQLCNQLRMFYGWGKIIFRQEGTSLIEILNELNHKASFHLLRHGPQKFLAARWVWISWWSFFLFFYDLSSCCHKWHNLPWYWTFEIFKSFLRSYSVNNSDKFHPQKCGFTQPIKWNKAYSLHCEKTKQSWKSHMRKFNVKFCHLWQHELRS